MLAWWIRGVTVGFVFLTIALGSAPARAGCTKDDDCESKRICNARKCVEDTTATTDSESSARSPPLASSVPARDGAPPTEFYSPPLMAAGIVMLALTPVTVIAATLVATRGNSCTHSTEPDDPYSGDGEPSAPASEHSCNSSGAVAGLSILSLTLFGAGVPMIVVGSSQVPVSSGSKATIRPWFGTGGAGLNVKLDL